MRLVTCRAWWGQNGEDKGNEGQWHFSEICFCSDLAFGTILMFFTLKINKNKIKLTKMGKSLTLNIHRNK